MSQRPSSLADLFAGASFLDPPQEQRVEAINLPVREDPWVHVLSRFDVELWFRDSAIRGKPLPEINELIHAAMRHETGYTIPGLQYTIGKLELADERPPQTAAAPIRYAPRPAPEQPHGFSEWADADRISAEQFHANPEVNYLQWVEQTLREQAAAQAAEHDRRQDEHEAAERYAARVETETGRRDDRPGGLAGVRGRDDGAHDASAGAHPAADHQRYHRAVKDRGAPEPHDRGGSGAHDEQTPDIADEVDSSERPPGNAGGDGPQLAPSGADRRKRTTPERNKP